LGYASYLEHAQLRLEEALQALREAPPTEADKYRRRTQALLEACQAAIERVSELRTMVQDPRFDLAYEVTELDREKAALGAEISQLEDKRQRLLAHAQQLEHDSKRAKMEKTRLEREIARKDAEFEAMARANPAGAYELYSKQPSDSDSE
jgi:chromosome segregation ATPase